MATLAQIAQMAEISSFYITQDGTWLRIQSTDMTEGYFVCYGDDDSYDEFVYVNFSDVDLSKSSFMRSVKTTVSDIALSDKIVSIPMFAEACKDLTHEQIYELFEDSIDKDLRNQILNTFKSGGAEPVRNALQLIGKLYYVQSLINY